jgi:hypothetical protein
MRSFGSLIPSSMALQFFVGPWPLLQFRNLSYTDGRTPWTSDQLLARPLPRHRTAQTQNKRTHRYPGHEWDWNPRSQLSSEQRQFMRFSRHVMEVVSAEFPRRRIDRSGSILWAPVNPDLTPLNILFLSYINNYLYTD